MPGLLPGSLAARLPLAYKKSFFDKWLSPAWHFNVMTLIFFGLLAMAMLAPVGTLDGIPNIRDYQTHIAAIMQADMAMTAGQFPLRTMPLEYSGWFYPFYQFYSPTSFTLAAVIYKWLTPANPLLTLRLLLWLGITLGGFNMFVLARWLVKSKPAALLAGVMYLSAPYYIIILTHLGGLNEILALGMLPAILYFSMQRYYYPHDNLTLVKLAILWYLFITTHLVTAVYAGLFIGILLLLATCRNPRHWHHLISVGIAGLSGCLLAMWFLAPAVWLQKYLVIGLTFSDTSYIQVAHPLLSNLLFPNVGFMTNVKDSLQAIRPSVGLPILFSVALCCYGYFKKLSCGQRRADFWLPYLLIIFFSAFFFVWSPVNIWRLMPQPLLVAQYCWRLLGQVIWIGALLSAWAICWLFKNKLDIRHVVVGSMLVVLSSSACYTISQYATTPLASVMEKPVVPYNRSAYKINFVKYPQFVQHIDSSLIDFELLQTGFDYQIQKNLFNFATHPAIIVRGSIPQALGARGLVVTAYINDKLITTQPVKAGKLDWNIDLSMLKSLYPDIKPLTLKFYLRDHHQKIVAEPLPIKKAFLTGFIDPDTELRVEQVQPSCQSFHSIWDCDLNVSKNINLVVLPVLYYPKLLKVTVDGKRVDYQSVMFEGSLLAALVLPTTQMDVNHQIRIEFTGLGWANLTSSCAWLALLMMSATLIYTKIRDKRLVTKKIQT